jgi:hypothetical protein
MGWFELDGCGSGFCVQLISLEIGVGIGVGVGFVLDTVMRQSGVPPAYHFWGGGVSVSQSVTALLVGWAFK